MAAEIKKAKAGVEVTIAPGERGAFEVLKDDALVFSKLRLGRFPTSDAEILDAL